MRYILNKIFINKLNYSLGLSRTGSDGFSAASEKYGNTEGNFIISYTDETGKEYQDTLGVITEIQPPVIVTDTGTEDNSKRSMQWWMICFVSVECILVAAVYYFVKRRKK